MPYKIRKVKNQNCYSVKNTETNQFKSKCTSFENARAQVRLLNAVKHGWKPSQNFFKKSSRKPLSDSVGDKMSKKNIINDIIHKL